MIVEPLKDMVMKITFKYDVWMINKIRTLDGRLWNPDGKFWSAPITEKNIKRLEKFGFSIPKNLMENRIEKRDILSEIKKIKHIPNLNPDIKLYPYQHQGVEFIEHLNGRALIGDAMRLGKSIQSLAWCGLRDDCFPVLIICESTAKYNWEREITHVLNGDYSSQILSTRKAKKIPKKMFTIINYNILDAWKDSIKDAKFKTIILDEIQNIKNSSTLKTKATKKICKGVSFVIGLSGTPIKSRPVEFYNGIKILKPDLFPNYYEYINIYCGGFGKENTREGHSNTEELHQILTKNIMIRRTKQDVWKHLPELTREVVPLEINNRKQYEKAKHDFINWIAENYGVGKAQQLLHVQALAKIGYLRRLAAQGKIKQTQDWIDAFLQSGEKLVVFFVHTRPLQYFAKRYENICTVVNGETSAKKRMENIDRFTKDSDCQLFLGNIISAGTSISLRPCSNIVFFESGWTPGDNEQAEERCSGHDQTNKVNVTYIVAQNTIEEEIIEIIDEKRKTLSAILDGKELTQDSMLSEVLKKYKG